MFLVLLLIVLLPFYRYPIGPSIGEGTLVRYVGAMCLPYAIFRTVRLGRVPPLLRVRPVRWYFLFITLVFISYFRSGFPFVVEGNPILTHVSMALLLFIVFATVDSIKSLRWVLFAELGAVSLGGLYLIREWQAAHGWQTGHRGGYMVGDGNLYSIGAAMVVPLALCMSRHSASRLQRIYCIGCCLVSACAVMVDGSRGGLLGIAAALGIVFWNSRNRYRNFAIGLVLLLAFNLAYSRSPLQRMLHPNEGDQFGADARLMQWHAGLRMIQDYPLAGVGYGRFKSAMGRYVPADYKARNMAHNAFLYAAAEMGLPTLAVLLAMFVSTYRGLTRINTSKPYPPLILDAVAGLKAGLWGVLLAICFVSGLQEKELYFILFLSMCVPLVARRSLPRRVGSLSRQSRGVSLGIPNRSRSLGSNSSQDCLQPSPGGKTTSFAQGTSGAAGLRD